MQPLPEASNVHQVNSDEVQLWIFYSGLLRDEGCEMLPLEAVSVHFCTAINWGTLNTVFYLCTKN